MPVGYTHQLVFDPGHLRVAVPEARPVRVGRAEVSGYGGEVVLREGDRVPADARVAFTLDTYEFLDFDAY